MNFLTVFWTDFFTLLMIAGDAPRCFSGENIESISLSVNFEENALSFLMASMY